MSVFVVSFYLELICIIEADLHGRDHPGLEQRTQDTVGYCVGDEMKVERISPERWRKKKAEDRRVYSTNAAPSATIKAYVIHSLVL